jgi:hypothetical protein
MKRNNFDSDPIPVRLTRVTQDGIRGYNEIKIGEAGSADGDFLEDGTMSCVGVNFERYSGAQNLNSSLEAASTKRTPSLAADSPVDGPRSPGKSHRQVPSVIKYLAAGCGTTFHLGTGKNLNDFTGIGDDFNLLFDDRYPSYAYEVPGGGTLVSYVTTAQHSSKAIQRINGSPSKTGKLVGGEVDPRAFTFVDFDLMSMPSGSFTAYLATSVLTKSYAEALRRANSGQRSSQRMSCSALAGQIRYLPDGKIVGVAALLHVQDQAFSDVGIYLALCVSLGVLDARSGQVEMSNGSKSLEIYVLDYKQLIIGDTESTVFPNFPSSASLTVSAELAAAFVRSAQLWFHQPKINDDTTHLFVSRQRINYSGSGEKRAKRRPKSTAPMPVTPGLIVLPPSLKEKAKPLRIAPKQAPLAPPGAAEHSRGRSLSCVSTDGRGSFEKEDAAVSLTLKKRRVGSIESSSIPALGVFSPDNSRIERELRDSRDQSALAAASFSAREQVLNAEAIRRSQELGVAQGQCASSSVVIQLADRAARAEASASGWKLAAETQQLHNQMQLEVSSRHTEQMQQQHMFGMASAALLMGNHMAAGAFMSGAFGGDAAPTIGSGFSPKNQHAASSPAIRSPPLLSLQATTESPKSARSTEERLMECKDMRDSDIFDETEFNETKERILKDHFDSLNSQASINVGQELKKMKSMLDGGLINEDNMMNAKALLKSKM